MHGYPIGRRVGRRSFGYKDAIIYQSHVKVFADSDADGIGDFRGLTSKLHYLEELGVNTIWLLPFYPSPLKDDGYDIADYTDVHSSYGTITISPHFLREAHRRGIRVITELVINHTSDQHPWFQRARRAAAGSRERDFYVWSDDAGQVQRGPDHFQGFRTLQLVGRAGGQGLLLAPFLLASAGPELRQPRGSQSPLSGGRLLDAPRESTACAWTPCPISTSGRAPVARTWRKPTPSSSSCAATSMPAIPTACCWPRPTNGPRTRPPT